MLKRLVLPVLFVLLAPCAVLAQEQAFTNRATELKQAAAADAATVASLPENAPVKVLARAGGWTRVEAQGQSGWVRVFHLRFPSTVQTSSGGGLASLGSALGIGRTRSQQATLATTGIRGLSTEELKNASPDGEALRRMQSYRADRASAERFAREARLAEARIEAEGERR